MRKLVLTTVAVAFAVLLASFAPRPWSPGTDSGAELASLSPLEMTLAAPALPVAPPSDAH
jgi:hypothetical protein